MDNYEVLNILEESWSKQRLMEKIKKGQSSEKIVQDFIKDNKKNLDVLINLLNQKDSKILDYMEVLANCEINLINELKEKENISSIKVTSKKNVINPIVKMYREFQLSSFMKKWSNQFVIVILIMISIISLTKQAWA